MQRNFKRINVNKNSNQQDIENFSVLQLEVHLKGGPKIYVQDLLGRSSGIKFCSCFLLSIYCSTVSVYILK